MAGIEFDTWDAPLGFEFPGGEIAAEDPPKGTGESLWSRWVQSILQQDKGGPICDSQSMKFFHLLPWNFSAIEQSIDVAKVFISKRQAMLFLTNAFAFLKLKKKLLGGRKFGLQRRFFESRFKRNRKACQASAKAQRGLIFSWPKRSNV